MLTRILPFLLTLMLLVSCGPSTPPATSEPASQEAAAAAPIDPMGAALKGVTFRWLEAHYPGREFTLSELTVSQASGEKKLCGVWTYAGNSAWREYFITSSDSLKRFGEKPTALWEQNCSGGTPQE